ncbi:hypothetical protein BJ741DRAFT_541390, partial [Chytriomyces cf. hyalinus JEL632]
QVLASIAEAKNVAPLPVVNEKLGLRLPPERNALTGLNFQILPRVCNFTYCLYTRAPKHPLFIFENRNLFV